MHAGMESRCLRCREHPQAPVVAAGADLAGAELVNDDDRACSLSSWWNSLWGPLPLRRSSWLDRQPCEIMSHNVRPLPFSMHNLG